MPRVQTATRTRTQQININRTAAGQIVPYRPQGTTTQTPQVIIPQPVGTYSKPPIKPTPQSPAPEIIDATIVPKSVTPSPTSTRRPVVNSDARPSTESAHPQYHPSVPIAELGFRTYADWAAWREGKNKSVIDEEAEAYDFARKLGKPGGSAPPGRSQFLPRGTIVSDTLDLANKYAARNGLPSLDNYGYENAQPVNPGLQPGSAFASNPFKSAEPLFNKNPSTPSNFDADPYNFDIDPDTGLPFTDLQKTRGKDLGRPAWHIDPRTGNPWGSDEPGDPISLPFDGYPGGSFSYPVPDFTLTPSAWKVTWFVQYPPDASYPDHYDYYVSSATEPIVETRDIGPNPFEPGGREIGFLINGSVVGSVYDTYPSVGGGSVPKPVSGPSVAPYGFSAGPLAPTSPSFAPIGKPTATPAPFSPPAPYSIVSPTANPAPLPVQDPRLNPTIPTPLPYAPNKKLPDSPYTTPVNPSPIPAPFKIPTPSVPGQPSYAPEINPSPRRSPTGSPQPSTNPSSQPIPSRPVSPTPDSQLDRPKNPPIIKTDNPDKCPPCPPKCPPEELSTIFYKKFVGCNVTPDGRPDRFKFESMSVPANSASAIKSVLDSMAEIRAQECTPCCYWDIKKGTLNTLYVGIPRRIGQEFTIPKGAARAIVTYSASDALSDNTIRNLIRIAKDGNPANTFCNVGLIWLVTEFGNVISSTEIWCVGTEIMIPFEYRNEIMRLRLLPKQNGVNFSVSDSGDRWVQVVE